MTTVNEKPMTEVMQLAHNAAMKSGSFLYRQPGGYWTTAQRSTPPHTDSYGTTTVQGMVERGFARYVGYKHRRHGKGCFPIEVQVLRERGTS